VRLIKTFQLNVNLFLFRMFLYLGDALSPLLFSFILELGYQTRGPPGSSTQPAVTFVNGAFTIEMARLL
jgi:hypothetical protein